MSSSRKPRSQRGINLDKRDISKVAAHLGIDVDELHDYLWKKSNRHGVLLITQGQVGKDLNLYPMAISRVFRQLQEQGRIRVSLNMSGKWQIAEPEAWKSLQ